MTAARRSSPPAPAGAAIPARGVPIAGIELSGPMTEQLRTKTGETSILVIAADMATWTLAET